MGGGVVVVKSGVHLLPVFSQVDLGSVSNFSCLTHLDFKSIPDIKSQTDGLNCALSVINQWQ